MITIPAESEERYLRPKEIARYFGVSLSTVRRWVKKGKLAAVETPGGHSRIVAKDFFEQVRAKQFSL